MKPVPLSRAVAALAYAMAASGLLVLAFGPDLRFDKWGIIGASGTTLIVLVVLIVTGLGQLWLVVGGAWIYGAVIELIRAVANEADRVGLGLLFTALAVGALGAYTAWRREWM